MSKRVFVFMAIFAGAALSSASQTVSATLAQRIGHYNPEKNHVTAARAGAGSFRIQPLIDPKYVTGPLNSYQRGVIDAHSSIVEHFHNRCEEVFIILDGGAQFTVDGRTSLIQGPAAVPDRMGHAHAIYNPAEKPLQWITINVGMERVYDTFDLGDSRVDVPLDAIPQFISTRLDQKLLRPVEAMDGGKGTVLYRRALEPEVFSTPWAWVDHLVLQPGAATGARALPDVSEVYYVVSGQGTVTVGNETEAVKAGDGIPVDIGQARSFTQVGIDPLELIAIGVAKDMQSKVALMNAKSTHQSWTQAGGASR